MNNSIMEDTLLHCPICLDFAEEAVEANCCGNVFCNGCLQAVKARCPCCRHEPISFRPSQLARRAIGAMAADCPFLCGTSMTRSDIKHHLKVCTNRQYTCPAPRCGTIAKKKDMAQHLVDHHQDTLLRNMENLFHSPEAHLPSSLVDQIAAVINDIGAQARLGESGKYYCGKSGCNSQWCCDGQCGPTNGCNCASCQKLDLKSRRLRTGWMVNRQGAPARLGTTGMFYCGRRVMRGVSGCDGYCGPTNGPQCSSCETLQRQTRPGYLYGDVWQAVQSKDEVDTVLE